MKEIFKNNFEKYKNPEKYDDMYGNYQDEQEIRFHFAMSFQWSFIDY